MNKVAENMVKFEEGGMLPEKWGGGTEMSSCMEREMETHLTQLSVHLPKHQDTKTSRERDATKITSVAFSQAKC